MKDYSYQLTKKQYDYLLPVFGNCGSNQLFCRIDRKIEKYFFIGSNDDFKDLLIRCKYI